MLVLFIRPKTFDILVLPCGKIQFLSWNKIRVKFICVRKCVKTPINLNIQVKNLIKEFKKKTEFWAVGSSYGAWVLTEVCLNTELTTHLDGVLLNAPYFHEPQNLSVNKVLDHITNIKKKPTVLRAGEDDEGAKAVCAEFKKRTAPKVQVEVQEGKGTLQHLRKEY